MKLMPWHENPWKALDQLQEEINKLFDYSPLKAFDIEKGFSPSVDISEDKDNIYVEADIPGFDQKDIKVKLLDDSLVISGNKEESKEEKRKNYHRIERATRNFYRQIPLIRAVEGTKVKATYKNGVLKLVLPKKEEEKGREISIDVE